MQHLDEILTNVVAAMQCSTLPTRRAPPYVFLPFLRSRYPCGVDFFRWCPLDRPLASAKEPQSISTKQACSLWCESHLSPAGNSYLVVWMNDPSGQTIRLKPSIEAHAIGQNHQIFASATRSDVASFSCSVAIDEAIVTVSPTRS
jgi:hypothetical protein